MSEYIDENYKKLFEYLSKLSIEPNTINEIISCFIVKNYNKDELFARQGETADKIGFITEGLFFMYIIKDDGNMFAKEFMPENNFLLSSFSPNVANNVNICSVLTSQILEAKYSRVQAIINNNPTLKLLSNNKLEIEYNSMCERLESFAAISAYERYLKFKQKFSYIEDKIPQYLIASYLGITPTHLCRIKAELNKNYSSI